MTAESLPVRTLLRASCMVETHISGHITRLPLPEIEALHEAASREIVRLDDQVERLTLDREKMQRERDEARLMYCFRAAFHDESGARSIAKLHIWDCFAAVPETDCGNSEPFGNSEELGR